MIGNMWLRWMFFTVRRKITDKEYIKYLDAIKSFIKSDKIYPFSAECFVETLTNEIRGDLTSED